MKKSLSKIIDEKLFQGVDQLKSTPQYNQVSSQLETIPEEYGKYVNQLITYALSFFPLLILFIMAIYFMMAQSTISDKRELLEQLIDTNYLVSEASQYEKDLVGRLQITSLAEMKNEITRLAGQQGIDSASLSVESFDTQKIGGLNKSKAELKLSNLNTPELIALMRVLAVNEKFKIHNIDLKRTTDSISGNISLIHFGKNIEAQ